VAVDVVVGLNVQIVRDVLFEFQMQKGEFSLRTQNETFMFREQNQRCFAEE
jgi:hypothetical protein